MMHGHINIQLVTTYNLYL